MGATKYVANTSRLEERKGISVKESTLATAIAIVLVFSLMPIGGCMTTRIKQHNLPCHNRSQSDVIRSATSILVMHGFRITLSDTVVGIVQGETEESFSVWTGSISKRVWQVNIKKSLEKNIEINEAGKSALAAPASAQPLFIIAIAKVVSKKQNAFGATMATSETYFDDDSHKDWEWYWNVRKGLEEVCGASAVISVKKMN